MIEVVSVMGEVGGWMDVDGVGYVWSTGTVGMSYFLM
jgi:hypothetical protein